MGNQRMKSFSEELGKMRTLRLLWLLCLLPSSSLAAQNSHPEALLRLVARNVEVLIDGSRPGQYQWLTAHFFTGVTKEKLEETLLGIRQQLGPIERHRVCKVIDATSGELEFIGKNGKRVRAVVRLEPSPPYGCTYLLFSHVDEGKDTWEQLAADMMKLPGDKAASVHQIHPKKTQRFVIRQTDPLAIGSSFKLLVLNQLAEEIAAEKRKWTDVVTLTEAGRSLPSGILQDWPLGSPVTLHTLASLMIARSDNTAADHLMLTLGRGMMEAQQTASGVLYPERNKPFLRTSELFKIKLVMPDHVRDNYPLRDEQNKRTLLKQIEKVTLSNPRYYNLPIGIEQVEWYFTTDDMGKMMERLRSSSEWPRLQSLLTIVKPFDIDDHAWEYLGFKGGAEMGVLNLTLLGKLRGKEEWYTVSFTWNRNDQALDEPTWIRLVQRAMLLVERGK